MDVKVKLGSTLQEKIEKGLSAKDIAQWASDIFPEYCIYYNQGEIDKWTYDTLIDLMTMEAASEFEFNEEQLRAISDRMMNSEGFSKVQLGWGIKQRLDEGLGVNKVREWASTCIYDEYINDQEISDIIQYFWMIDGELNMELTEAELRLLAEFLIYKAKDPIKKMEEMAKERYAQKNESHYFELGNHYLDLLCNDNENLQEKNFKLAVENFKLALKEWDARAFNQLGITYGTWVDKWVSNRGMQEHYLRLANDAFCAAIVHNHDTQVFFNKGLVLGLLASLNEGAVYRAVRINYYESADYSFKRAIEHGEKKAFGHLAVVYEILGSIDEVEKRENYNHLAIEHAKIAIEDGWRGCYGTTGTAYRNLGDLSREIGEKERYYQLAIRSFREVITHGYEGFREELDSVLCALRDLNVGMDACPCQGEIRYDDEHNGRKMKIRNILPRSAHKPTIKEKIKETGSGLRNGVRPDRLTVQLNTRRHFTFFFICKLSICQA